MLGWCKTGSSSGGGSAAYAGVTRRQVVCEKLDEWISGRLELVEMQTGEVTHSERELRRHRMLVLGSRPIIRQTS